MLKKSLVIAAVVVLAACSGGGAEPVSGTIEVTAQDYSFAGVPEVVASGAELTFANSSDAEVHEMIVLRIPDDETRTLEELLELPEEETTHIEFQGILIALPNEAGASPEDESTSVTIGEPGRYAMICMIPQGADPDTLFSGEEPGDGTPHAFLGMMQEFQVEEA